MSTTPNLPEDAAYRERKEHRERVQSYCKALDIWASTTDQIDRGKIATVRMALMKSCLAKRLVYMREGLRTRRCPIHKGEWSGCYGEPCPAGCDTCGCCCGWLPEDAPAIEGLGWTFWLAHAIDPDSAMPGIPPAHAEVF